MLGRKVSLGAVHDVHSWCVLEGRGAPARALRSSSDRLAQRPERGTHVRAKQLGLLPRREVPALVEPVVVDQLGISPLGPASRGGVYLVREDANGHRDRNMLGLEEGQLGFPV